MQKNLFALACLVAATPSVSFSPEHETPLPDLRANEPLTGGEDLLPQEPLDVGAYAELPAEASLPTLDPKLTFEEQARALGRLVRAGGRPGFLALIQALRHSGIAIASPTGALAPIAGRQQGIVMSLTTLQMMSHELATTTEQPLTSYLDSLAAMLSKTSSADVGQALLKSLHKMVGSPNMGVRFLALVIAELRPSATSAWLLSAETPEKIVVSPLQMALLGMRFSAELAARRAPGIGMKSIPRLGTTSSDCLQAAGEQVQDAPTVQQGESFDEMIRLTERDSTENPAYVERNLRRLSEFLRLHALALKSFDFLVSAGARERLPLIRTKTTEKGERKTLFLEFKPSYLENETTRCLDELTTALNLKRLKKPADNDFFNEVKVKISFSKVFDKHRLVFSAFGQALETTTNQKLNGKGVVEVPMYGAPQPQQIPANFKPYLVSVPTTIEYEAPVMDFFEATDTEGEAAVRGLLALDRANEAKRKKTFTIAVQDWIGKAEGTVTGAISANFHKQTVQRTSDKTVTTKTDFDFDLTNIVRLSPGSQIIPPVNFPVPNLPPQYQMPQLAARYSFSGTAVSNFSRGDHEVSKCWDPCDPKVTGQHKVNRVTTENFMAAGVEPDSQSVFQGPWSIDTRAGLVRFTMMLRTPNKTGQGVASVDETACDGDPAPEPKPPVITPINDVQGFYKTVAVEVPFTLEDGVAVVKKKLHRDFGIPKYVHTSGSGTTVRLPATLDIEVDVKLPLP